MNLLLNYDYNSYPYTTASYIEMACKKIQGLRTFRLSEIQNQKMDLVFNIMPFDSFVAIPSVPCAYWEIDNHLVRGRNKAYYSMSDIVYVPQEYFIDYYPSKKTKILPLAAYPELHKPIYDIEIEYDVGFIGNDTYPERRELLDRLERKYKVLRTTSEPGLPYSEKLAKCTLLFNRSLDNDVNMRFFEAMSCEKLLLTDYLPQQEYIATDGVDYVAYKDWEDLDKKVEYYLEHPVERTRIAINARNNILKSHTYLHRILQVLNDFGYHFDLKS